MSLVALLHSNVALVWNHDMLSRAAEALDWDDAPTQHPSFSLTTTNCKTIWFTTGRFQVRILVPSAVAAGHHPCAQAQC